MDFRERYKRVGFGREDVEINRALRSQRRDKARREMRSERYNVRRCVENNADDSFEREQRVKESENKTRPTDPEEEARRKAAADLEAAVQKRLLQLEKWREERNRRRIQEKKRAKPVFKVGVVHHRMYSPPITKNPGAQSVTKLCRTKPTETELPPKRVTRATEKRLAIKAVTNQQKHENLKSKKVTIKPKKIELQTIPLIPKDHQFKAPLGITPLPMFGRQALENTNENMELDLSSINISTARDDFLKNFSINSAEHCLTSIVHSSVLPKYDKRRSNVKKSNADLRDKSANKSLSDSVNNTSVEAVSLKVSDDEENVRAESKLDFSFRQNTKSTGIKTRSSKAIVSDLDSDTQSTVQSLKNREIMENQNGSESNLSIKRKKMNNKRSTKITNETVDSDKSMKDISSISEDQKTVNTRESSNINGSDNPLNSSFSKEKKANSLSSRKKLNKIFTDETVNLKNVTKENSFLSEEHKNLDNNSSFDKNTSTMDSTFQEQNKVKQSKRKFTNAFDGSPSSEKSPKESTFTAKKKSLEKQNNGHFNWLNLMDESIVSENKNKFIESKNFEKITTEVEKCILKSQDDSLIKFSPRRSSRQPPEKSLNQTNSSSETKRKSVKISPFKQESLSFTDSLNMSSSSEPTRQKTSENDGDDSQNFSLNLSLVNDSTPDKPPAFFSPYIVTSRGKRSVRKEVQLRRLSQPSPNDIPTKDTIMQTLNISVEEEERTAQYYKYILNQEIDRLNERCDIWNEIKEDVTTPEEIRYTIQAAVGQTKLLVNKKFERFRCLVLDCETGKGEMLVTCKDLQGFWDMMYMEIKDCDNRFNKLEELKQKKWIEEMEDVKDVHQFRKKKIGVKKPIDKKKTVPAKSSSLRAHIIAARKKKIEGNDTDVDIEMTEPIIESHRDSLQQNKNLRSLNIKSTEKIVRRTSTPKSSNKWQPILKKLSQGQKPTTSPLIVMKLSQMCKTPEVHVDDSIVYINSGRTPAKSILKASKDDMAFTGKSANKVFFKEQPMEYQMIENNNISNISDNSYFGKLNDSKEPTERKLNFESDSFNSSHIGNEEANNSILNLRSPVKYNKQNTFSKHRSIPSIVINAESPTSPSIPIDTMINNLSAKHLSVMKTKSMYESPMISVSPLTLMDSKVEDSNKKATKTKKQISFKDDINESYSRTLRSRKFSVPLTPRLNLKNSMRKVDEDYIMDVDDSIQEYKDDSSCLVLQKSQLKELYLNADGIICQRIVPGLKDTPELKENSLQILNKNAKYSTPEVNTIDKVSTTPKSKSRNNRTPTLHLGNLVSPVVEVANKHKKSSSTPRVRRQNIKKSLASSELRNDNANLTIDEISEVKVTRRKTRTPKRPKNHIDEIENINEPSSRRLRANLTPVNRKSSLETNSKRILTPSVKRRNSKRLQENIEPDLQETYENVKTPRKSTSKRNTSKISKNFENNEQQTDVSKTLSEALTPNRRKSLRIARVTRNED